MRAGFAATNATNRKSSGAGYYGNMELSFNVSEFIVTLGHSVGRAYTGTHGNGTLTSRRIYEGNATNNDWPGIDATTARGVTGASGSAALYSDFITGSNYGISDRSNVGPATNRRYHYGGRCARTAP